MGRTWKSLIPRLAVVCLLAGLLGACAKASVFATHAPMQPDTNEALTLKAEAKGAVDRIELRYEVTTLQRLLFGIRLERVTTPMQLVETCNPVMTVTSLTCTHTVAAGFPAGRLIRYQATSFGSDGSSRTESYQFAAGAYPWPNDPIPIRVTGAPAERMDVVFIPDTDITVANFRNGLAGVIENLYFKYYTYKGSDTILWRSMYNFYYSTQQGNYEETCTFTNPPNIAQLRAIGDAVAILHSTNLRDCSSGGVFSSEINYDKTLIHETGHALFGLKDEYCCDTSYAQQTCNPNIYASLNSCQADAPSLSKAAADCRQISRTNADGTTQTVNFWRIDDNGANGCMMGDRQHSSDSDHGAADRRRINWRWAKCLSGQCYTTPECP